MLAASFALPRLYAILDTDILSAKALSPMDVCDAWLDAGISLIQLRAKHLGAADMLGLASALSDRVRAAGAAFIVNDRVDVAVLSGADGVHLGQDDLATSDARRLMAPHAVIGRSTHNDVQVRSAVGEGATYVAIGPVFSTSSKARPDPVVGLDGVDRARAIVQPRGLPLVAIGGITLARAPDVIAAGADAVAVIADLLGPNPAARAREWIAALR